MANLHRTRSGTPAAGTPPGVRVGRPAGVPRRGFDGAVTIYRRCRQAGVTPRGLIDCMIAAIAVRHGVAVLASDADMARIADVMPLGLYPASPRPRRGPR